MLILSIIAGIGAQSFLIVLRAEQEMDEGTAAIKAMQLVLDELRLDAGNLIPAEMGGHQPYEEGVDSAHGTPVYRLLTRLPERYSREEHLGQTQALLVEFALEQDSADELQLVYSKQPVGASGKIGEPFKGVLAEHVAQFTLTPEMGSDDAEGSGAESGEGAASVPKGLNVTLVLKDSAERVPSTVFIPIDVKAEKPEKQEKQDSGSEPKSQGMPEQPEPETNQEE
jgi:hypothetical protein